MDEKLKEQIMQLKKERGAVILAHYYVDGRVQEIADFVMYIRAFTKRNYKTQRKRNLMQWY